MLTSIKNDGSVATRIWTDRSMVWGMAQPSNFGEFFPNGDYVGWNEDLTDYFNNKMPAEKKAVFDSDVSDYIFYTSENIIQVPGLRPNSQWPPFGSVAAHEVPKRFRTEKKVSSLGSLVTLTNRITAVDEALKAIIEGFEPDKHRFFPIEIEMPKGAAFPKRYFVLVLGQFLDSFSQEHSDPASWSQTSSGRIYLEETEKHISGIALSRRKFGEAHLWREFRVNNEFFCFSDQLISEVSRSGLRLPKHYALKEI
jgi:hypothetical protein